jgi:hypothetical protein
MHATQVTLERQSDSVTFVAPGSGVVVVAGQVGGPSPMMTVDAIDSTRRLDLGERTLLMVEPGDRIVATPNADFRFHPHS